MKRTRHIKPSFFTNEELTECAMATRLLFIGLWTLADREGRLEDRPKKIRMEIFPADDVDVDAALDELAAHGFIQRYEAKGIACIQIATFARHQHPHARELPSELPPPPAHDDAPPASAHTADTIQGIAENDPGTTQARPRHDPGTTQVMPEHDLDRLELDLELELESTSPREATSSREGGGVGGGKRARQARPPNPSTPIPEDFAPDDALLAWAAARAPNVNVERETERFVAYWQSTGGTKRDWRAAWRTWLLKAQDDAERHRTPRQLHRWEDFLDEDGAMHPKLVNGKLIWPPGYRPTQADINSGLRYHKQLVL